MNDLDFSILDAQVKRLIEVVRKPRSMVLADLIRSTSNTEKAYWDWIDWIKANRN